VDRDSGRLPLVPVGEGSRLQHSADRSSEPFPRSAAEPFPGRAVNDRRELHLSRYRSRVRRALSRPPSAR
jgi:hypothetical protein